MTLLQAVVDGLLTGGLYALMAAGLALIFGVLRVLNFAHGEFIMLGMYAAVVLYTATGIDPYAFTFLIAAIIFVLGVVFSRIFLERLPHGNMDAQLLLTLGISYIAQNVILLGFGATPKSLNLSYSSRLWEVGGLYISQASVFATGISLTTMFLLYLVLGRTPMGRALRATADDHEAASAVGVNVRKVRTLTFGLGVALASVAGVSLSTFRPASPTSGQTFLLLMFVAIVLGGLGSIEGAVVGALIVGVTQAVAGAVLPLQLQNTVVFSMLLIILLIRPQGLFAVSRRV